MQSNLQFLEFKVKEKFNSELKNHVFYKLVKIFNIPTDLENFLDLLASVMIKIFISIDVYNNSKLIGITR